MTEAGTLDDAFERLRGEGPPGGDVYTALAPVYEALYARGNGARVEGQFRAVRERLPADAGTVVETGCGTGDLLARLETAYPTAVGLDLSPQMAAIAAGTTARAGVVVGSMDRPPVRRGVDALVSMGCALGHVRPDAAVRRALAAAADRLAGGGTFVCTVHDREHLRADPDPRELSVVVDGYRVEQSDLQVPPNGAATPPVEGGVEFEWRMRHRLVRRATGESASVEHSVPIRAFGREELRAWLADVGFADVRVEDREFVGDDGRGLVATARAV